MTTDWTSLMPHAPLGAGANEYVERPDGVSKEVTQWILANRSPVLLGGPAGVGKSTELAHAAKLLQPNRVACLIPLDRWENMRRIGPNDLLERIASRVAFIAKEKLGVPLSTGLFEESQKPTGRWSAPALAQLVLKEVSRISHQGRVTLLIDGLEKVPEGAGALELFDALAALPEEVELVAVIPWHAAFGPRGETVIRPGERFVSARALEVLGQRGTEGREFFYEVLLRRLQLSDEALGPDNIALRYAGGGEEWEIAPSKREVVKEAIFASGGIPRIFLQLMADAATYARLRRAESWPNFADLRDASTDQINTFRRFLQPGDADAAQAAVDTDGRELEHSRKIRLMAHGMLLERLRDQIPLLALHPLAERAIVRGSSHE